jgi:hypothetical protein
VKLPLGLELHLAEWPLRRRILTFCWIVWLGLAVGFAVHLAQ